MRKNILGAFAILFITVALFLIMDDISKSNKSESQVKQVEVYDANSQPELATNDEEEED